MNVRTTVFASWCNHHVGAMRSPSRNQCRRHQRHHQKDHSKEWRYRQGLDQTMVWLAGCGVSGCVNSFRCWVARRQRSRAFQLPRKRTKATWASSYSTPFPGTAATKTVQVNRHMIETQPLTDTYLKNSDCHCKVVWVGKERIIDACQ